MTNCIKLQSILAGLRERGHNVTEQDSFSSIVFGVQRDQDTGFITAYADFRRDGHVDGF